LALDGVGGQRHTPAALPPEKYLYRRLGGPQGQCGPLRRISPPTGIRSCAEMLFQTCNIHNPSFTAAIGQPSRFSSASLKRYHNLCVYTFFTRNVFKD